MTSPMEHANIFQQTFVICGTDKRIISFDLDFVSYKINNFHSIDKCYETVIIQLYRKLIKQA